MEKISTAARMLEESGAKKLLQEGKADMVAIGRSIYKDPDFVRKMMKM